MPVADTIRRAWPMLCQPRIFAACERAMRTAGGPVPAQHIFDEIRGPTPMVPCVRSLSSLLGKVAALPADETGRQLVQAGLDGTGAVRWAVAAPEPSPVVLPPDVVARLAALTPGEYGDTAAEAAARILGVALTAIERRPAEGCEAARPAPERHEPAPAAAPQPETPAAEPEPTDCGSAAPVEVLEPEPELPALPEFDPTPQTPVRDVFAAWTW